MELTIKMITIWASVILLQVNFVSSLFECTAKENGMASTPNIPDSYFNPVRAGELSTQIVPILVTSVTETTYVFTVPSVSESQRNCSGNVVALEYCYKTTTAETNMNRELLYFLALIRNAENFVVDNKFLIELTPSRDSRCTGDLGGGEIICCGQSALEPPNSITLSSEPYSFGVVVRDLRLLQFSFRETEFNFPLYQLALGQDGPSVGSTIRAGFQLTDRSILMLRFITGQDALTTFSPTDIVISLPTTDGLTTFPTTDATTTLPSTTATLSPTDTASLGVTTFPPTDAKTTLPPTTATLFPTEAETTLSHTDDVTTMSPTNAETSLPLTDVEITLFTTDAKTTYPKTSILAHSTQTTSTEQPNTSEDSTSTHSTQFSVSSGSIAGIAVGGGGAVILIILLVTVTAISARCRDWRALILKTRCNRTNSLLTSSCQIEDGKESTTTTLDLHNCIQNPQYVDMSPERAYGVTVEDMETTIDQITNQGINENENLA